MKLIAWLREEKNIEIVFLLMGVCSAIAVLASVIYGSLHNGEEIYPSVEAVSKVEIIETEDGEIYLEENEYVSSVIVNEDEVYHSMVININEASAAELMLLPNIGQGRAEAIIEYREMNGGFGSVEELLEVAGIGEKIFNEIYPYCVIEGPRIQYKEQAE